MLREKRSVIIELMEFVLKVILSFLVGGSYVAGVVWLSEKLGSKIGAAIAGLPSTILISIIFIAALDGADDAEKALSLVPLMFMATLAYALAFAKALKLRRKSEALIPAVAVGTLVWFLVVLVVRQASSLNFLIVTLISIISLVALHFGLKQLRDKKPTKIKLPKHMHAVRFVIGGSVIAASIVAARMLDPQWGGIVASFPAMLGVILYYIYKSQGAEFVEGFIKSLPISYFGSLTFIVIVHETVTSINFILSLSLGMVGALIYTILLLKARK